MDVVAQFIVNVYNAAINNDKYRNEFANKRVVLILDNALAHNQAKERAQEILAAQGNNNNNVLTLL